MSSGEPVSADAHPPALAVREAVARALAEDLLPMGDLTAGLVPPGTQGRALFVARAEGVLAGRRCAEEALRQVDAGLEARWELDDGSPVKAGAVIGEVRGPLRSILTAERTALSTRSGPPARARASSTHARRRPGCGRSRRPPSGPGEATTTAAACPRACS